MLLAPRLEGLRHVFTCTHPVRWGDMDAMGHVNNTIYFRYLEHARIEWFDQIGCRPGPEGMGPVIVNAWCHFYRQVKYPADLEIRLYAGLPKRSSFETVMEIRRTDDPGTLCSVGGATTVWVDFPREKSAPLPEQIRAMLG